MLTSDEETLLKLLALVARTLAVRNEECPPEVGDLVVEVSKFWPVDLDSIGFLVGHGEAAYAPDGSGPTREVWDIRPLSRGGGVRPGIHRWENAKFMALPLSPDRLRSIGVTLEAYGGKPDDA